MPTPYLLLGTIVKPQGVRGEVKLHHETDDPSRFLTLQTLYLRRGEAYEPITVLSARVSGSDVFLTLEGVTDRNAAEAYRNVDVYVDRAHARELAENEVFIADLLGVKAVDEKGQEIGTLTDVLPERGADVLVFQTARGSMMAPFLKRLVLSLSTESKQIVLDSQTLSEVALYENSDTDDLS